MRTRSTRRIAAAIALAGCAAPDTPAVREPGDRVESVSADADAPFDPTPPADTDVDPPTPVGPPASWGDGFVEVLRDALASDPMHVAEGDLDARIAPQITTAFVADLDGDGVVELVTGTHEVGQPVDGFEVRVLRWSADGLVPDMALRAALEEGGMLRATEVLGAADLDRDGLVDLLGGNLDAVVRWGTAPGAWGPWTSIPRPPGPWGSALAVLDVDHDGLLDLLLGNSGCTSPGHLVLQEGGRELVVRDDLLGDAVFEPWAATMTRAEDGTDLIFVIEESRCFAVDRSPRVWRRDGLRDDGLPHLVVHDPSPPDAWWRTLPTTAGAGFDALTPMGAGLDDLDGDGILDLVVTTGLAWQVVMTGNGDGTFSDPGGHDVVVRPSAFEFPEFPWGVGFPDVDLDGRPEILWTIGDDAGSFLALRGHPLRNALSWNGGDLAFTSVELEAGLDALGGFQALALADVDGDGDAEVAAGGAGAPPAAWRNDVDVDGRRGVSLRFVGTTSDPFGLGARVEAYVDGLPTRVASVGASASRLGWAEPWVFVGAGDATVVDLVRVTWPSGVVSEARNLPVGRTHVLVEPEVIAVRDADRAAPADGASTIVVDVTPRRADGTPDAAAVVEVDVAGTPVPVALARADAGWRATITAPTAPGATSLVVRVDGVELGVRPRLWWR